MTVQSSTRTIEYPGNNSTGPFPVPFLVLEIAHLSVVKVSPTGVVTTIDPYTGFTFTGAGTANGEINLTAIVATGDTLIIERVLPLTQPTDFRSQGSFLPGAHESAFDRATMQIQQLTLTTGVVQRVVVLEATQILQDEQIAALGAADVALDARVDALEAINAAGHPWEVMLSLLGPLTQDEVLAQFLITDSVALGAGTAAKCRVAPTVGASVEVFQNGVSIGYLTWAGASVDAVSTVEGTLAPGDLIVLTVASADAAQLDVSITLKGTR